MACRRLPRQEYTPGVNRESSEHGTNRAEKCALARGPRVLADARRRHRHGCWTDGQGQIGSVVQMANWSSGWAIASPYAIGHGIVFLLKTGDGLMHINDVGPNGAIEAIRDNRNWSAGWTTGLAYTRGPQTVLLIYKASSGLLRIHSLTGGAVSQMIEESTVAFGTGWTSMAHYTVGLSDYLFFLKESSGEMQVHGVGANGGIGQRIQSAGQTSSWTIAPPLRYDIRQVPVPAEIGQRPDAHQSDQIRRNHR